MYLGRQLLELWQSEADEAMQSYKEYEKAHKSSAKRQRTDDEPKSDKPKSDKTKKSDGAKGAKAKAGTAWSRFIIGNRTVLGPSVYKKYCDAVERDWEIPVMFTGPDGAKLFKVLEMTKYEKKLHWAKNPAQNLSVEGEDYY
eukprot:1496699-Prymnesium_polylepis.1